MSHHADKAFGQGCKSCDCPITRRDTMLDAQLQQARTDLRRAEDELSVWRGLSAELTALRALRTIVSEELAMGASPEFTDVERIRRAYILSAPTTIQTVTEGDKQ